MGCRVYGRKLFRVHSPRWIVIQTLQASVLHDDTCSIRDTSRTNAPLQISPSEGPVGTLAAAHLFLHANIWMLKSAERKALNDIENIALKSAGRKVLKIVAKIALKSVGRKALKSAGKKALQSVVNTVCTVHCCVLEGRG